MSLQRSGYLTATTEWYVTGLTLELEEHQSPGMDVDHSGGLRV